MSMFRPTRPASCGRNGYQNPSSPILASAETIYPLDGRHTDIASGTQLLVDAGPAAVPRLRTAAVVKTEDLPTNLEHARGHGHPSPPAPDDPRASRRRCWSWRRACRLCPVGHRRRPGARRHRLEAMDLPEPRQRLIRHHRRRPRRRADGHLRARPAGKAASEDFDRHCEPRLGQPWRHPDFGAASGRAPGRYGERVRARARSSVSGVSTRRLALRVFGHRSVAC